MSNDTNASLAKTFVTFSKASAEVIRVMETELSDSQYHHGCALEEAANNLEAFTECQYKLAASQSDYQMLLSDNEIVRESLMETQLDRAESDHEIEVLRTEVEDLRAESYEYKQLIAELKLDLSIANADLWEAKQDQREDDILLGRPVMPEGLVDNVNVCNCE